MKMDPRLSCSVSGVTAPWQLTEKVMTPEAGITEFHWHLSAPSETVLPPLKITFAIPQSDVQVKWRPGCAIIHHLLPWWWGSETEPVSLCRNAPVVSFFNLKGENRLTFALSDTLRPVRIRSGSNERDSIKSELALFAEPDAPVRETDFILRLDLRPIHYSAALNEVAHWYEKFYPPAEVPAAALEPLYSSWYQFLRKISAGILEKELPLIAANGFHNLILDDGWQMAGDYPPGDPQEAYSCCGTWSPDKEKFPDMKAHIARFHQAGIRYMMWFAVPFVGEREKETFARFQGKYLKRGGVGTWVLDPRFPEVREYLIGVWERAVKEWGADGLKLDFIDDIALPSGAPDPAEADHYAGRDFRSIPQAVNALLLEAATRLRALKPEILIEFRQKYTGPAIRRYGNMFRAGDCAMDMMENRVRTLDLRLLAGNSAVHSDMVVWSPHDDCEIAALQLWNVLFAVPQFSMELGKVTEEHQKMMQCVLKFFADHREARLHGTLLPEHPELCYTRVSAFTEKETLTAVYADEMPVEVKPGLPHWIVNATHTPRLLIRAASAGRIVVCDLWGEVQEDRALAPGLTELRVPVAGVVKILI